MRSRRRFGQHFLEPGWIDKVVAAIAPRPGDRFLEIGPGSGALTLALAPRVSELVAVEIDRELAAGLRPRLPAHVRLIEGDILELPADALLPGGLAPRTLRVAGNLPYYISSPILFRLLALARDTGVIADATVMLQLEVAERLVAGPGSRTYGVLSIQAALDARARLLLRLPPGAFRPRPEVWSAVVRLEFVPALPPPVDRGEFDGLVRTLFAQRRKTVNNALKPLARARGLDERRLLGEASIDGSRRPETLELQELKRLADIVATADRSSVV